MKIYRIAFGGEKESANSKEIANRILYNPSGSLASGSPQQVSVEVKHLSVLQDSSNENQVGNNKIFKSVLATNLDSKQKSEEASSKCLQIRMQPEESMNRYKPLGLKLNGLVDRISQVSPDISIKETDTWSVQQPVMERLDTLREQAKKIHETKPKKNYLDTQLFPGWQVGLTKRRKNK